MNDKETLYEAFGELAYAIAKADGLIDNNEISKLTEIIEGHKWAANIKQSFNYEWLKDESAENIFEKALNRCKDHGPAVEYIEMIDLMKQIAAASEETYRSEANMINSFSAKLIERFINDIEK